jgi:hypothetical protein
MAPPWMMVWSKLLHQSRRLTSTLQRKSSRRDPRSSRQSRQKGARGISCLVASAPVPRWYCRISLQGGHAGRRRLRMTAYRMQRGGERRHAPHAASSLPPSACSQHCSLESSHAGSHAMAALRGLHIAVEDGANQAPAALWGGGSDGLLEGRLASRRDDARDLMTRALACLALHTGHAVAGSVEPGGKDPRAGRDAPSVCSALPGVFLVVTSEAGCKPDVPGLSTRMTLERVTPAYTSNESQQVSLCADRSSGTVLAAARGVVFLPRSGQSRGSVTGAPSG